MMVLFRLWKVGCILLGVLTISVYAIGSFEELTQPALLFQFSKGLLSLACLLCAGYLMNDICDVTFDMASRPEKVVVGRHVSKKVAGVVSGLLFAAGLALAFFVNHQYAVVVSCVMAGLTVYNLYSKKLGFFKDILISLIVVSIYPISLALTSGGIPSARRDSLFIFPVWLFLTVTAYEIIRDIIDAPGDRLENGCTLPLKIGSENARKIAVVAALVGLPFAFLPFILKMCGGLYLGGFIAAVCVLLFGIRLSNSWLAKALFLEIIIVTIFSFIDIVYA